MLSIPAYSRLSHNAKAGHPRGRAREDRKRLQDRLSRHLVSLPAVLRRQDHGRGDPRWRDRPRGLGQPQDGLHHGASGRQAAARRHTVHWGRAQYLDLHVPRPESVRGNRIIELTASPPPGTSGPSPALVPLVTRASRGGTAVLVLLVVVVSRMVVKPQI